MANLIVTTITNITNNITNTIITITCDVALGWMLLKSRTEEALLKTITIITGTMRMEMRKRMAVTLISTLTLPSKEQQRVPSRWQWRVLSRWPWRWLCCCSSPPLVLHTFKLRLHTSQKPPSKWPFLDDNQTF